jgi:hypothetical protein
VALSVYPCSLLSLAPFVQKWRRVTDEKADISADKWYCHLNTWDPAHNTCEAVEEPSSPDAQAAAAAAAQQQAAWAMAAQQQQQPLQPHGLANPFASQIGAAKKAAPATAGGASGRKRKKKRGSDDDSAEDTSATNSADEAFYAHIDGAASTTRRSAREKKPNIDDQYTHPDFDVEVSLVQSRLLRRRIQAPALGCGSLFRPARCPCAHGC